MTKNATFSIRIDEELKESAQAVLDKIGLPMSLAVELFLKQIAERGKLPFSIGCDDMKEEEQEERVEQLWKSFIVWLFKDRAHFDSDESRRLAENEYGFTGKGTGSTVSEYVLGDSDGYPDRMTKEQRDAYIDLLDLQHLLYDAKELIYWALSLDFVFVPEISSKYSNEADEWRLEYLTSKHAPTESG